jgi:hypothetical protein
MGTSTQGSLGRRHDGGGAVDAPHTKPLISPDEHYLRDAQREIAECHRPNYARQADLFTIVLHCGPQTGFCNALRDMDEYLFLEFVKQFGQDLKGLIMCLVLGAHQHHHGQ